VDAGEIGSKGGARTLAADPRVAGSHFAVAISVKICPVILTNVCLKQSGKIIHSCNQFIYFHFGTVLTD